MGMHNIHSRAGNRWHLAAATTILLTFNLLVPAASHALPSITTEGVQVESIGALDTMNVPSATVALPTVSPEILGQLGDPAQGLTEAGSDYIDTLIDDPAEEPQTEAEMLENLVGTDADEGDTIPPPRPVEIPAPRPVQKVCCACFFPSDRQLGLGSPWDQMDKICKVLSSDPTRWGGRNCHASKAFPIGAPSAPFTSVGTWFKDNSCEVNRIAVLAHGRSELLPTYVTPVTQCIQQTGPLLYSCDARLDSCSLFKNPKTVCQVINTVQSELKKTSCKAPIVISGFADDSYFVRPTRDNLDSYTFDCISGLPNYRTNERLARRITITCDGYEIAYRELNPRTQSWEWVTYTRPMRCEYERGVDPVAVARDLEKLIEDLQQQIQEQVGVYFGSEP